MIQNIIFDFGNVLIPLHFTRMRLMAAMHGIVSPTASMQTALFAYEKGEIDCVAFLALIQKEARWGSPNRLKKVWNSVIGDLPEEKIVLLEHLKKEYKLFLLSNINQMHEDKVKDMMGAEKYKRFTACFDGLYYSHHIGHRKPEKESFERVLQENNLQPAQTLFIDDMATNTTAAKTLGINVWKVKNDREVYKIKKNLSGGEFMPY